MSDVHLNAASLSAGPDGTTGGSEARITVVESEGCHFCADAHRTLAELSQTFTIRVMILDARSEAGQRLLALHRVALSPLVLLNGAFFSHGRLPRRKLERELTRRGAGRAGV